MGLGPVPWRRASRRRQAGDPGHFSLPTPRWSRGRSGESDHRALRSTERASGPGRLPSPASSTSLRIGKASRPSAHSGEPGDWKKSSPHVAGMPFSPDLARRFSIPHLIPPPRPCPCERRWRSSSIPSRPRQVCPTQGLAHWVRQSFCLLGVDEGLLWLLAFDPRNAGPRCSGESEKARNETRTRDPFLTIHGHWATLSRRKSRNSRDFVSVAPEPHWANSLLDMSQYAAIDRSFCHSWNPSGRTACCESSGLGTVMRPVVHHHQNRDERIANGGFFAEYVLFAAAAKSLK